MGMTETEKEKFLDRIEYLKSKYPPSWYVFWDYRLKRPDCCPPYACYTVPRKYDNIGWLGMETDDLLRNYERKV